MKKALILGVNGQDGSYLAEHLLGQGYEVIGWVPSTIPVTFENLASITDRIKITQGDLLDQDSLNATLGEFRPDEVYNLASPSSVASSWNIAVQIGEVGALGVVRLLEAIRSVQPTARFFQASSSEMFGQPSQVPQDETTAFNPRNPYAMAKLYAHWAVVNYRARYGLFAVSGILYNHESPRRPAEFVTRKITLGVARIKAGLESELRLGNLDARRDWGFAGDTVAAMHLMLNQAEPQDFVIGTGHAHSVREFAEEAFGYAGLDWREYVKVDPAFYRPDDGRLVANPARAKRLLGWEPACDFRALVHRMVEADLKRIGLQIPQTGG